MKVFLHRDVDLTPTKPKPMDQERPIPSINRGQNFDVGLPPHHSDVSLFTTPRLPTILERTEPPTSEGFKNEKQFPFGERPFEFHWRRDGENRPMMDSGPSSDNKPVSVPKMQIVDQKNISSRQRAMNYRGHLAVNPEIQWIGKPRTSAPAVPEKDPLKWDSPSPQKEKRKIKPNNPQAETVGPLQKRPPRLSGQPQIGGTMDKGAAAKPSEGKNKSYDKPWRVEKKPDKGAAKARADDSEFLRHVYPDGDGPDANLIKMLEREVIDRQLDITFEDIAALDDAKKIIQESVLLPLLMPQYFIGIRKPRKGVLLFGPPGTGKTMLAKALASKGQTTFFNVNASTLASKWKGDSEKLVRVISADLVTI